MVTLGEDGSDEDSSTLGSQQLSLSSLNLAVQAGRSEDPSLPLALPLPSGGGDRHLSVFCCEVTLDSQEDSSARDRIQQRGPRSARLSVTDRRLLC